MPILIMGLIALLVFITIVALVCSAGMAERRDRDETDAHAPTPMPPLPAEAPPNKRSHAA